MRKLKQLKFVPTHVEPYDGMRTLTLSVYHGKTHNDAVHAAIAAYAKRKGLTCHKAEKAFDHKHKGTGLIFAVAPADARIKTRLGELRRTMNRLAEGLRRLQAAAK